MEHYSVNQGLFPVVQGRKSHTDHSPGRIFEYSSELKSRAKRWDEKHLDGLRLRKDKLFDEYKEQQKKKRREAELINARYGKSSDGFISHVHSSVLVHSCNSWKVDYVIRKRIKKQPRKNNEFSWKKISSIFEQNSPNSNRKLLHYKPRSTNEKNAYRKSKRKRIKLKIVFSLSSANKSMSQIFGRNSSGTSPHSNPSLFVVFMKIGNYRLLKNVPKNV